MNERLQEISDFVDNYFDNKKADIILTEQVVEKVVEKVVEMNNIEKLFKIDN